MHFDRLWALFDYDLESEIKTETDIELVKKIIETGTQPVARQHSSGSKNSIRNYVA